MVDDGNMVARLQKPQILDLLGTVGIDNNKQRLSVGYHNSFLSAYKRFFILRAFTQEPNKRLCRAFLRVGNYQRTLSVFACKAAYADRAADAVHIAELMSHNEDARGILYERFKRICHNTRADLVARLHFSGLAADKVKAEFVFYYSLVAAARERHFNGKGCKLERFAEICAVSADADRQRCVDTAGTYDLMHFIEDIAFFTQNALHISVLKQEKIPVAIKADNDTVCICSPLIELIAYSVAQIIAHTLGLVFHKLFIVIDSQYRGNGL